MKFYELTKNLNFSLIKGFVESELKTNGFV